MNAGLHRCRGPGSGCLDEPDLGLIRYEHRSDHVIRHTWSRGPGARVLCYIQFSHSKAMTIPQVKKESQTLLR